MACSCMSWLKAMFYMVKYPLTTVSTAQFISAPLSDWSSWRSSKNFSGEVSKQPESGEKLKIKTLLTISMFSYQKCSNVDHIHPPLLPGDVGGARWKQEKKSTDYRLVISWCPFLPVIPIAIPSVTSPKIKKIIDLVLANSGPTLDTFL